MPTHRNVQWEPVVTPPNLTDTDEVFVMRTTGEIFLSYEEYISRLEWYLDKNWICDRTARCGLNFEQALESERCADRMISYFPPHLYEIVLNTIQGNKLNLDQLIQHIYTLLQNNSRAKLFISSYKVTFCKDVIRQFVRDHTYKKVSIPGSSYIVKKEIAELYNLELIEKYIPKRVRVKARSNDTPQQLAQRRESERINNTLFSLNITNLQQILSNLHNCTQNPDNSTLTIADQFRTDPDFPNLIIRCESCDFSHTLSGVKRIESFEYPKPDEDLSAWERAMETIRPCGTIDPVFSECKGDLLIAWNFVHTAHEFIELSPYSFRELEDVLIWERDFPDESPSVLLSETLTAVTRCLVRHLVGRIAGIVKYLVGGYRCVNKTNWEQGVRGYIRGSIQVLREISERDEDETLPFEVPSVLRLFVSGTATLEQSSYKRLSIPVKATLLVFLCEHIGMSSSFKGFVDTFTTQLHDTRSKLWEERAKVVGNSRINEENENGDNSENVKRRVETLNGTSDEVDRNIRRLMTQVKTVQQKVKSFCIEPLGQDRDFASYWYIPTIGYRVYAEEGNEWVYFDSKNEIEQLIGYLNEKGERESILKERIVKLKDEIFSSIDSYLETFLFNTEVRRSTRMAAMVKHKQSYVNSYAV